MEITEIVAIDVNRFHRIDGQQVKWDAQPQRFGGDANGNVTVTLADGSTRVYGWRETVTVEHDPKHVFIR